MADDWMETYTGRKFWPLQPNPDDLCIEDIAHALSLICRFGGHCRQFYSVAQHSCLVADLVAESKPEFALTALLHDAAEAYVGDVIRPIKRGNPLMNAAERAVMEAVQTKFGIVLPLPEVVKWADNVLLKNEHAQLMHGRNEWPSCDQADGPFVGVVPWDSITAEANFLHRFHWCQNELPS